MSAAESADFKYWAFISYSHQDNLATRGDGSGDHIQWANWLHEQLETFRVPDGYRDRKTATGEPMPERFFPTFRDEAELPTSHDLGGQIHEALRRSRFLIVIASPRSAASRYVNEEVRTFRQLGRGNRILTLIVDGEPNVRLHPKAGWKAADDCFCPALVHTLKEDGTVDEAALLPEEPIAADVRMKDAEPPHEMRASERAHSDRQGLLDFMKLKLIAGLMGVGLDELVQRDKRRAEEQLKRSRQELSRTEFFFARQLLDLKDRPQAYARLAKSLANDPDNRAATVLWLEEIRRSNRGALRKYLHEGGVLSAVFSPDGARILTASYDKTARIWDAASGKRVAAEDVARLRLLLEAVGSRRLNADGLMEPIPPDDMERLRNDFDTSADLPELLRWWWADSFTRGIHPSSPLSVPDFVRRRSREVLDWQDATVKISALKDARAAFPHHPLVLICLAEELGVPRSRGSEPTKSETVNTNPPEGGTPYGDPAWLAQYAASRLLAEPHYLTPLQSRMTDADRAARAYELKEGLAEDCYLGARLLQRQNRTDLAKKVIARACKLVPENEAYRKLATEL